MILVTKTNKLSKEKRANRLAVFFCLFFMVDLRDDARYQRDLSAYFSGFKLATRKHVLHTFL